MTRNNQQFDIGFHLYEGTRRVLAIWPAPAGRLSNLVDYWAINNNQESDLKPWLFMEVPISNDGHGNLIPDHQIRGVRSGSIADGEALIELYRKIGLLVNKVDWHVPFANNKKCSPFGGSPDFSPKELRYLRSDEPPTRQEMSEIFSRKKFEEKTTMFAKLRAMDGEELLELGNQFCRTGAHPDDRYSNFLSEVDYANAVYAECDLRGFKSFPLC